MPGSQARETAAALDAGGSAAVGAVSCPAVSSCTAAGYYSAAGVMHAFVVAGAITQPTTTTLALSARSVRYGHEQSERITVTVVPRYGGTPAGTVKVRAGHVTVCDITLAPGRGSCRLSARQLRPGTYRLTAAYAGRPRLPGLDVGGQVAHGELTPWLAVGFQPRSARQQVTKPGGECFSR